MGNRKQMRITSAMELKKRIENQNRRRFSPALLPSQERVVVYLHYWKNLSPTEIGRYIDRMGRPTIRIKESALIRLKKFYKYELKGKAA